MYVIVVFIFVVVLLFAVAFFTKRRFGVLGLALAAGSMLSELWAEKLTPIVRNAGLDVQNPPLIMLVTIAIVLLPAVVLLFSGPSYQGAVRRIIGALLFAALAFALLVEPIGMGLVLMGEGRMIYEFFRDNQVYIVTVGLIVAIIDLLGAHTARAHKPAKH